MSASFFTRTLLCLVWFWHLPVFSQENEYRVLLDSIVRGDFSEEGLIETVCERMKALPGGWDKPSKGSRIILVRLATFVPDHPAASKAARTNARKAALAPFAEGPFPKQDPSSSLLYLAAGLMGQPIDQESVMRFARDEANPLGCRALAMEAVINQDTIDSALEADFVTLSKSTQVAKTGTDYGVFLPPSNYPLKELAMNALKKLRGSSARSKKEGNFGGADVPVTHAKPPLPGQNSVAQGLSMHPGDSKSGLVPKGTESAPFVLKSGRTLLLKTVERWDGKYTETAVDVMESSFSGAEPVVIFHQPLTLQPSDLRTIAHDGLFPNITSVVEGQDRFALLFSVSSSTACEDGGYVLFDRERNGLSHPANSLLIQRLFATPRSTASQFAKVVKLDGERDIFIVHRDDFEVRIKVAPDNSVTINGKPAAPAGLPITKMDYRWFLQALSPATERNYDLPLQGAAPVPWWQTPNLKEPFTWDDSVHFSRWVTFGNTPQIDPSTIPRSPEDAAARLNQH